MSILASDWLKRLVLLLVIMLAAVVAMNQFMPLDVVPASASPSEFSAERAQFLDVAIIIVLNYFVKEEFLSAEDSPDPSLPYF